jgi:hypothetical protein
MTEAPDNPRGGTPSGVGGWLLLLSWLLSVVGPLGSAAGIAAGFTEAESANPALSAVGHWATYKMVTWVVFLGLAAVSVRAGWGLARGRTWRVVRRAKIALWIIGPVATLILGGVLPVAVLGSVDGYDVGSLAVPLTGALLRSVILATAWTVYLSKSKRVRATYASAPPQSDLQPSAL